MTPSRRLLVAIGGLAAVGLGGALWLGGRHAEAAAPRLPPATRVTSLGRVREAALSPDGRSVAYVADGASAQTLWVQDVSGGAPHPLATFRGIAAPEWSPDGGELLFEVTTDDGGRGSFRIPQLGGSPRWLRNWRARWGPGADRIAFWRGTSRVIHVESRDGRVVDSVVLRGDFGRLRDVRCSARAHACAILTERARSRRSAISLVPLAGWPQVVLATDTAPLSSPRWAPDGGAVYYLRRTAGTWELRKVRLTPWGAPWGPARVLAAGLEAGPSVSLSADGTRLVYVRSARPSGASRVPADTAGRSDAWVVADFDPDIR